LHGTVSALISTWYLQAAVCFNYAFGGVVVAYILIKGLLQNIYAQIVSTIEEGIRRNFV
jgi:hypothetical protein